MTTVWQHDPDAPPKQLSAWREFLAYLASAWPLWVVVAALALLMAQALGWWTPESLQIDRVLGR